MLSANSNNNFSFLETACSILVAWKNSNLVELTKETFMACIQSLQAMVSLSKYLISRHDFSYVLPGKFCSDPIEGRFGWYRQVNGGNFFMSINQLFLAEKKNSMLKPDPKRRNVSCSNPRFSLNCIGRRANLGVKC